MVTAYCISSTLLLLKNYESFSEKPPTVYCYHWEFTHVKFSVLQKYSQPWTFTLFVILQSDFMVFYWDLIWQNSSKHCIQCLFVVISFAVCLYQLFTCGIWHPSTFVFAENPDLRQTGWKTSMNSRFNESDSGRSGTWTCFARNYSSSSPATHSVSNFFWYVNFHRDIRGNWLNIFRVLNCKVLKTVFFFPFHFTNTY